VKKSQTIKLNHNQSKDGDSKMKKGTEQSSGYKNQAGNLRLPA
jgi:hypothetical protein